MCGDIKYEYTGEPAVTGKSTSYHTCSLSTVSPKVHTINYHQDSASSNNLPHLIHHGLQIRSHLTTLALCHCIDCQKWTGGPYTSNAVVPRTNFKVTAGTPKTWDVTGDSGKINKHYFCGQCGSSLYTELEIMPDVTCIKAGGLDGGAASLGGKIGVEFYTKDRVNYLHDVEGAKQVRQFE